MSTRIAFGVGFGLGLTVSALLGAPLVPALIYGALTGAITAAISAIPPIQHRLVLVQRRYPNFSTWWNGPSIFRRRHTHVAHHTQNINTSWSWNRPSSWFPMSNVPNSSTKIVTQPSGNVAVNTAPTNLGGTVNTATKAVPSYAHNVGKSTTLFANNDAAPRTQVQDVTSSVMGGTHLVTPSPRAHNVQQSTSLFGSNTAQPVVPQVVPPTVSKTQVGVTSSVMGGAHVTAPTNVPTVKKTSLFGATTVQQPSVPTTVSPQMPVNMPKAFSNQGPVNTPKTAPQTQAPVNMPKAYTNQAPVNMPKTATQTPVNMPRSFGASPSQGGGSIMRAQPTVPSNAHGVTRNVKMFNK